ncbi:MAG: sigma-70 family RNA polymerase sigma factor [Firmicutes bacterium]|nr:sigma-70 family RNA polymerase sigma factor [Bacillota bacterium]
MIDKDTFCRLVRQNEKAMYSVSFSILSNESDAADAISEALYRAYKNLDTLKNEYAFKPWILRIVRNCAVELVRSNKNLLSIDDVEVEESSGENDIVTALTLRKAVEQLKQPYKEVVVLYYYEDLSIAQISKITGASVVTAKQQLSRARKMLRDMLMETF